GADRARLRFVADRARWGDPPRVPGSGGGLTVLADVSMIRSARAEDAAGIAGIYNHFVKETVVTFEETPVDAPRMAARISEVTRQFPWLVWEDGGSVLGYADASRWKERTAYRFCVETTIYLAPEAIGRGIGTGLYRGLIEE